MKSQFPEWMSLTSRILLDCVRTPGFWVRILLGTSIYVFIVILASHVPSAAGLMLTFPALNGLAFAVAPQERIAGMARPMLFMPVLNGLLCTVYIVGFLMLARDEGTFVVRVAMLVAISTTWAWVASWRVTRTGVPSELELSYVLVVSLLGLFTAVTMMGALSGTEVPLKASAPYCKIFFFVLIFIVFSILMRHPSISNGWLGVLGGFPLVPFFGLFTLTGDGTALEVQRAVLRGMAITAMLSPIPAVWFIWLLSRRFTSTPAIAGLEGSVKRFYWILLGWAACAAFICVASVVISRTS